MADNKDLRHGRDRSRVSGSEDYEVRYLAEKMGVSEEDVKNAIKKVGNDRTKLEQYLTDHGKA